MAFRVRISALITIPIFLLFFPIFLLFFPFISAKNGAKSFHQLVISSTCHFISPDGTTNPGRISHKDISELIFVR